MFRGWSGSAKGRRHQNTLKHWCFQAFFVPLKAFSSVASQGEESEKHRLENTVWNRTVSWGNSYGPIIGPYLFLGKFVWTNGPETSSKVSPYTGIGPWMALHSIKPSIQTYERQQKFIT